jgi:hypothetical protein
MSDDSTQPGATETSKPRQFHFGITFGVGFFIAIIVGFGAAFAVIQGGGFGWLVPIAFFLPFIVLAAFTIPALIQRMREAARNAPSPESKAAAAGGEGVEAGTKALPAEEKPYEFETPTLKRVNTHSGKVFPYQLERAGPAPGCQFGCAIIFAIIWNSIVGVFVYQFLDRQNRGGAFQWIEALTLAPFVLIGIVLILGAILAGVKWLIAGLVGRVDVELSSHPLVPASKLQVSVTQTGTMPLAKVTVTLVCTEKAVYMAGTSKSVAEKVVAQHTLVDPDQSPDGGALPLIAGFTVPADAMHSFDTPNNQINWTIRVSGRVLGVLPFSSNYSVTIAPEYA